MFPLIQCNIQSFWTNDAMGDLPGGTANPNCLGQLLLCYEHQWKLSVTDGRDESQSNATSPEQDSEGFDRGFPDLDTPVLSSPDAPSPAVSETQKVIAVDRMAVRKRARRAKIATLS
jgi:hypothetical protein